MKILGFETVNSLAYCLSRQSQAKVLKCSWIT